jgi:oxygen-dependent protoporphyrinogen oxidase
MKKVVIVGGGIAGLASAYRIQEEISQGAPYQCRVLEGSGVFGGKIATERVDGFVVEKGPDSFISQKPAAIQLCKKLGLTDRLAGTNTGNSKTYVYTGGKLVTMPDGLSLMIPTRFMPFALTPLFSLPGKVRMAMDLILPGKSDDMDESLASFIRRRMGEEALRKMAEPMLAGIYASDPETMSIKSTFPMFFETEQKYRSLILGMLARKRTMKKPASQAKSSNFSLFMTLKNGLSEMVDAVIEKSPDIAFDTETKVSGLSKENEGWALALENGEKVFADAVIFATPAVISAHLLDPLAPNVAELLRKIKYVSTATVTLGYRKETFSHPLNGFGFVVPRAEKRKILACTWTSSKFPHRAPEGHVMLRCFIGGALNEELAEQDPESLANMVKDELKHIMGIKQVPVLTKVFHYKKSNVQYHVGHADLIDSVQENLSDFPGLYLAGSAYTGIGIPDCIQNGSQAAEAVIDYLNASANVEKQIKTL